LSYLVLARKSRPQTFAEVVGQKPVVRTLQNALTQNRNDKVHWALSHPRVIEVRTDKTEADTYAQVRAAFENSFKV
jgi:hypothetical protein